MRGSACLRKSDDFSEQKDFRGYACMLRKNQVRRRVKISAVKTFNFDMEVCCAKIKFVRESVFLLICLYDARRAFLDWVPRPFTEFSSKLLYHLLNSTEKLK